MLDSKIFNQSTNQLINKLSLNQQFKMYKILQITNLNNQAIFTIISLNQYNILIQKLSIRDFVKNNFNF
jgi:hypothetical protein